MSLPLEPTPPITIGSQPRNADEVNNLVGLHLRAFVTSKNTVNQDREFLSSTDLTAAPYLFSADQQTLIKSAVADLDTALDAIDMTFINRIVGMF